jgi:hypothetical protein
MKSTLNLSLDGYVPANRDAKVILTHEATGQRIERKPFLDGALIVRDIEPGFYDVEIVHPNLINPIDRRRIRLFPQPTPTRVRIPVPEQLFVDNPIVDIPDADLGPVQQQATDVRDRLLPVGGKSPGEAIRAADWNVLVSGLQDLASAVLELTTLVSPKGHNHPEIETKINEVQGNLLRFSEAFGRSLLELRREFEAENLRRNVDTVLDRAGASGDRRTRIFERLGEVENAIQTDSATFSKKLANFGFNFLGEIQDLADEQGDRAEEFLNEIDVVELQNTAQVYAQTGTVFSAEEEMQTYRRTATTAGGRKTKRIFGGL